MIARQGPPPADGVHTPRLPGPLCVLCSCTEPLSITPSVSISCHRPASLSERRLEFFGLAIRNNCNGICESCPSTACSVEWIRVSVGCHFTVYLRVHLNIQTGLRGACVWPSFARMHNKHMHMRGSGQLGPALAPFCLLPLYSSHLIFPRRTGGTSEGSKQWRCPRVRRYECTYLTHRQQLSRLWWPENKVITAPLLPFYFSIRVIGRSADGGGEVGSATHHRVWI
ncbi:hypothetical protein BDP81DRAFT_152812 [Colletotrichum phormii]|uniref:Uncharacterized protein n=1 Tax=Colletotrichum phormii TaxID=359342 RepID=A0AAI9ZFF3_9PEZI|nr:uncharacterized protein BDP81DRAFT_152812 [Colletotrichum phormii]KAK1622389.1 hypothetical protein BDP81DRAFT_152812 [Colletotrichum phormii]